MRPSIMQGMLIFLLAILLAATQAVSAETSVVVVVDHARLYSQNDATSESLGNAPRGRILTTLGPLNAPLVPVKPPEDVAFWIYAELVRQGCIISDKAQIRSGAGLSHKVICSVDRGTPIESRGKLGDWLRINPPPQISVWINRSSIAPVTSLTESNMPALPPEIATGLMQALAETNTTPSVQENSANIGAQKIPQPVVLPSELAGFHPINRPDQGRIVRITGTLRHVLNGSTSTPAAFRLSGPDKTGGIVTLGLLMGNKEQLAQVLGDPVTIEGRVWWLSEEAVPVVQVVKINQHPGP